jgi:DNA-binding MarR family transcriptional regulator
MKIKDPKLHLLLHSADLVEHQLRIQLAPLVIRPRQARVLDALDRMGTASQIELAREFDITPASMSTMIARLGAADLVICKTNSGELRTNAVTLSDHGRGVLKKVRAAWREVDLTIENAIGRERAQMLAELAGELRDALGGGAPGQHEGSTRYTISRSYPKNVRSTMSRDPR